MIISGTGDVALAKINNRDLDMDMMLTLWPNDYTFWQVILLKWDTLALQDAQDFTQVQ